ncbi:MAG: hypothetical protein PWQ25_1845 [Deferribacteres bacterium]|jgi:hypothetical protein|nr:hypothetical protein [Deferribacteres bacterium]
MRSRITLEELKKQNELLKQQINILKAQPSETANEIVDKGVSLYIAYNYIIPIAVILCLIFAPIIFPSLIVFTYLLLLIGIFFIPAYYFVKIIKWAFKK